MNNNQHDISDLLWTYVHGQMNENEKAALEKALQSDPQLRAELNNLQGMDREFRLLGRVSRFSQDELECKILAAWEEEQSSPQKSQEAVAAASVPILRIGEFVLWVRETVFQPWAYRTAFAMAASLLVLVGIRNFTSDPLEWGSPEFATMQYRGAGSATSQTVYSAEELRDFSAKLRTAIKKSYKEQRGVSVRRSPFTKSTEWLVISKWQELPAESLYVQVEAYDPRHKTLVREWSERFVDSSTFLLGVDQFGAGIAKDLASLGSGERQSEAL